MSEIRFRTIRSQKGIKCYLLKLNWLHPSIFNDAGLKHGVQLVYPVGLTISDIEVTYEITVQLKASGIRVDKCMMLALSAHTSV